MHVAQMTPLASSTASLIGEWATLERTRYTHDILLFTATTIPILAIQTNATCSLYVLHGISSHGTFSG